MTTRVPRRKPLVILGGGAFAREVFFHVRDALGMECIDSLCFFDENARTKCMTLEGRHHRPVISSVDDLARLQQDTGGAEFVVGVGTIGAKKALVAKAESAGLTAAPTIVHPHALIQDATCALGRGGVICPGVLMTTSITLGDFVVLNLAVTVGHDTVIGDYVTCNPGAQISGNVHIETEAFIGVGAVVREGCRVATGVVVGGQAFVSKDIGEPGLTVVGVPAKPLVAR